MEDGGERSWRSLCTLIRRGRRSVGGSFAAWAAVESRLSGLTITDRRTAVAADRPPFLPSSAARTARCGTQAGLCPPQLAMVRNRPMQSVASGFGAPLRLLTDAQLSRTAPFPR